MWVTTTNNAAIAGRGSSSGKRGLPGGGLTTSACGAQASLRLLGGDHARGQQHRDQGERGQLPVPVEPGVEGERGQRGDAAGALAAGGGDDRRRGARRAPRGRRCPAPPRSRGRGECASRTPSPISRRCSHSTRKEPEPIPFSGCVGERVGGDAPVGVAVGLGGDEPPELRSSSAAPGHRTPPRSPSRRAPRPAPRRSSGRRSRTGRRCRCAAKRAATRPARRHRDHHGARARRPSTQDAGQRERGQRGTRPAPPTIATALSAGPGRHAARRAQQAGEPGAERAARERQIEIQAEDRAAPPRRAPPRRRGDEPRGQHEPDRRERALPVPVPQRVREPVARAGERLSSTSPGRSRSDSP